MLSSYVQGLRMLSPSVALYFVALAMVGFAFDGGIYAVLFNLFLVRLGYGPESIGLVSSSGTLAFAISSLPAGLLGERLGSRQVLLLGLGLMVVGALLLPQAELLTPGWRLPWLMVNAVVTYLGLACYFVNCAPYVLGMVGTEQRNQIFSLQTALLSLSAFGGSLAGGMLPPLIATLLGDTLARPAPYRYALLVAGLALIAAIPAIYASRPGYAPAAPPGAINPAPASVGIATTLIKPIIGLLALIALIRMLQVSGLAVVSTFFNVYLDAGLNVPTAQIGMILATARLLAAPAALTTSLLTARFGNRAVVIAASLGTVVGLLPIALIPHWGAAGLGFITVICFSWVRYASSMVYFLDLVPPERRATVSGVTEMAAGICFTMITFGGGYVIALSGYRSIFFIGALLTAISALAFWLAFRRWERK